MTLIFAALILIAIGCQKKKPEDLLAEADLKMNRGDVIGARIDLKELLNKQPLNRDIEARAHFALSRCYYYEKDFIQARAQLNEVYKILGPKNRMGQDSFKIILTTYRVEKQFKEGIKEAEALIKTLPPDDMFPFELNCMIADLMLDDQNTTGAISHLEKLVQAGKDHERRMPALDRLVGIYAAQKKFDDSIKIYGDYIDKFGDDKTRSNLIAGQAYYYEQKGNIARAREYYDKAVQGFRTVIEKTLDKGEKADLNFSLARTFEIQKKFEEARKEYQTIFEKYPDTTAAQPARIAIGDSYYMEGKKEKALEYFQNLLKFNPNDQQFNAVVRNRIMGLMRERTRTLSESTPTTAAVEQKEQPKAPEPTR